jgi:hypothetical protein
VGYLFCAGATAGAAAIFTASPSLTVGDAVFLSPSDTARAGTALLSVQDKDNDGIEAGFNTSAATPLETKSGADLLISNLQTVPFQNANYFQLTLNVDEPQSAEKSSLLLDELKIFATNSPPGAQDSLATLGTPVFDLDSAGDMSLLLDDTTNGQGRIDLVVDLPVATIAGGGGQYLVVYSSFSDASAGPETWAAVVGAVPEPSMLCLAPLAGLVLSRRRK